MANDDNERIDLISDEIETIDEKKELDRYRKYLKTIQKYDAVDEDEYLYLTNEMTNIINKNKDNFTEIELLELTQKLDKIECTKDYTVELLELTKEIKKIIKPIKKYEIPKVDKKINPKPERVRKLTNTNVLPKIKKESVKKEEINNIKNIKEPTFKDLIEKNISKSPINHFDTTEINKIRNISNKEEVKPKKKASKLEKTMWTVVFALSVVIFSGLCIRFLNWEIENRSVEKLLSNIYDFADVSEVVSMGSITNVGDRVVENPGSSSFPPPQTNKPSDYWYYMSMSMLNADFSELKKKNNDTAGWIWVAGTSINYPYVQSKDNSYYLTHSFDKSYNSAGWVFLDYRNNKDEYGKNNILYAHGRLDNTMFGSLKAVVSPSWYNNSNNYVIKTSTPTANALWQVFSVYTILPESYYIRTKFTVEEFETFINTITSRSVHDFGVNMSKDDKILTLSSCYDSTLRVVLHAKLIRLEEK